MLIEKATIKDFDSIFPLFSEFNNQNLSKKDWRRLFNHGFDKAEGYNGLLMKEKEDVVGYIGLIFSRRVINNVSYNFFNLSGWVVKNKFRSKSLLLLFPALKLSNYTITDYSPSSEALTVLKSFGFKTLETHIHIIPPIYNPLSSIKTQFHLTEDSQAIDLAISAGEVKTRPEWRLDHLKSPCLHLLIKSSLGACYIIYTKTKKKRLPISMLHYVSNPEIFSSFAGQVANHLFLKRKTLLTFVDRRLLKGNKVPFSLSCKLPHPRLYRSEDLLPEDIDGLYSELTILNL